MEYENGIEINKEFPDTFEIPSAAEKARIKPGTDVKVGIILPPESGFANERVWVKVTSVTNDGVIYGVLKSQPYVADAKRGDVLHFSFDNVLAIDF